MPAFDAIVPLLGAELVDAVVLATPAEAHVPDARIAAANGVPALVEKPPAPDAATALALAEIRPEPWVGFNRRFGPGLLRLRHALPSAGRLSLALELHYPGGAWDSYTVEDDALLGLGTHLIDLARWLTASEIVRVLAHEVHDQQASFELELVRARAVVSCGRGGERRDLVEVRDDGGGLLGRVHATRLGAAARRAARPWRPNGLVALLAAELEAFARAVSGEQATVLATAADGAAVMATVEAVRRSASTGAPERPVLGSSI